MLFFCNSGEIERHFSGFVTEHLPIAAWGRFPSTGFYCRQPRVLQPVVTYKKSSVSCSICGRLLLFDF